MKSQGLTKRIEKLSLYHGILFTGKKCFTFYRGSTEHLAAEAEFDREGVTPEIDFINEKFITYVLDH